MSVEQAYTFEDDQETLPSFVWFRPDEQTKYPEYSPDDDRWCPPMYRDKSEAEVLKSLVRQGMKEKGFDGKPEYEERIERELSVILGKKFERYFLIIWDIMWYCRRNDIEYGIARGCLAPGTKVLTPHGFTQIENLKPGDEVFDGDGNPVEIPKVFEYDSTEDLVEIKTWFGANGNAMTADHKVLVSKALRTGNTGAKQKIYSDDISDPEWIRADQVEIGDFMLNPQTKLDDDYQFVVDQPVYEYKSGNQYVTQGTKRVVPEEYEMSYDLGKFFGWFISDGWIRSDEKRSEIGLCCNLDDDDSDIEKLFFSLFQQDATRYQSKTKKVVQYVISHTGLCNAIRALFSDYKFTSGTKYIPNELFRTGEDFRRGLLDGLWIGDGSRSGGKSTYTTVSPRLADDVYRLLLSLGMPAGVKKGLRTEIRKEFGGPREYYEYKVASVYDFDKPRSVRVRKIGNFIGQRVREVSMVENESNRVYDFSVPTTNSYVTDNYIVHNSGASSLVGYCLKITGVDPLEHNLLFERFLDPERDDAPDYDLDIQDTRRGEIKRYLEQKYGEDHVAGIATYGTYSIKSAFKAACRVMSVPFKEAAIASEVIIDDDDINHPSLNTFHKKYPEVRDITKGLMGRISNTGRHAAGVVVADKPLTDYVSIETRKIPNEDGREAVVAADKNLTEQIGLVKIDLLGLKALTIVADAVENVRKSSGRLIDWKNLTEDNERVFKMLSDGHTQMVFQAEESASTNLILEMKVNNFDELVTSNALVRSGAYNEFGPEYIAVKKGHKKPKYPTEDSKSFLTDTLSFPVFQEQSMQIIQEVAGMTVGESNQIRRLTAKKQDKSTLAPFKDKFIQGCIGNGVSKKEAEKLWTGLETTAEYQFNKCLVGSTKVVSRDHGEITILEAIDIIDRGEELYILGPKSIKAERVGEETYHRVEEITDGGEQETVSIWTDSETEIVSSFDHKHYLYNRWKEAYRIHKNDSIWTRNGRVRVGGRTYAGIQQTYDIVLATEPHAFYANGFLTHNSHAVSYSKLTYAMAYLKCFYPGEFVAAVLKSETDPGKISSYLAECNRLGLKVNRPDVNKSDIHYTYKDGEIYMGLSAVKYISDKTAEKIIARRPYNTYKEFMEVVFEKGSGLNTRMAKALEAIGAIRTPDKTYDEAYVKSNYFEYLGIPSFDDVTLTPNMRNRITRLEDLKEEGISVILGVVQEIVSKNGWTRISVVDETAQGSFFVSRPDEVKKGSRYLMLVNGNSMVDKLDLSEYDSKYPIARYLNGEYLNNIWVVGGSFRTTKSGKPMATIIYTYGEDLRSFMAIGHDKMAKIKTEARRGKRIKLALSKDGKWMENVRAV